MLARGQLQGEPIAIMGSRVELDTIKPGVQYPVGDEIDPGATSLAGEPDRGGGDEALGWLW